MGRRKANVVSSLAYAVFYIGILEDPDFILLDTGKVFPLIVAVVILALAYPEHQIN